MAQDISLFHGWDISVIKVQVRAANRGGSNADNGISWIEQFRIRDFLNPHISNTVPANRFHATLLFSSISRLLETHPGGSLAGKESSEVNPTTCLSRSRSFSRIDLLKFWLPPEAFPSTESASSMFIM